MQAMSVSICCCKSFSCGMVWWWCILMIEKWQNVTIS
jgi:hypothetical protein